MFSREVSKSPAAAWLAARHGIPRGGVCAVGNDYNDRDLLEWAGASYVVANAAAVLSARHDDVAASGHCGSLRRSSVGGLPETRAASRRLPARRGRLGG